MRIQVPKIVQPLPLANYAPELGAVTVFVWVNPSLEFLAQRETLEGQALLDWWAQLWSQGPDAGAHWTGADVKSLIEETADTDPGLWRWLVQHTWGLITAHRAQKKKA